MKISEKWLIEKNACSSGKEWWFKNGKISDVKRCVNKLLKSNHWNWANWLITRCFDKIQAIKYAVYAAEQVIGIYEKKYPNDDRPRKAIESAKAYLDNPTAAAAAAAAWAAEAAEAAEAAAWAAEAAAEAAAWAAEAAAWAAEAAEAAEAAAWAAAAWAWADNKLKTKIITYGLTLIQEGKK